MGQLLSRVRKKPSTLDVLEDLDKEIETLEEYRRTTEQKHKRIIGTLFFYSVALYIIGAVASYFYWRSNDIRTQVLLILPLIIFPFLVWGLKLFLQWFFRRKISSSQENLTEIRKKKKNILNEVKETETYKKATEILEKFDPEYKKQQREKEEAAKAKLLQASNPNLRQRQGRTPLVANTRLTPPRIGQPGAPYTPQLGATPFVPNNGQQQWPRPPGPPLPRPILPREAGVLDRVVDFLVGDGPSNRYALICQRCLSHNGMAMKEEFEYLAFRCCYCFYLNPARKIRPYAPRLPEAQIEELKESDAAENDKDSEVDKDETPSSQIVNGISEPIEKENSTEPQEEQTPEIEAEESEIVDKKTESESQ